MIELNLLPTELRKKRKKIELPEIPLIPIAAILVGVLLLIQFLLVGLIFLSKKQLSVLDEKWQALAPKKAHFNEIKKKISAMGEKTRAIEDLMKGQLNWARLLNELSNSITPNIWLTDLSYGEKMGKKEIVPSLANDRTKQKPTKQKEPETYRFRTLNLSGSAAGKGDEATAHIAHFIRALKESDNFFRDFDDIELVSIKKGSVEDQDIMNFDLLCRFKVMKK